MAETSSLHLPYPGLDDTVDVPRDMQALAEAAEGGLIAQRRTVVTALPNPAFNGQEVLYRIPDPLVGDGALWALRYNTGIASPYKWEFVGGTPMVSRSDSTVRVVSGSPGAYQAVTGGPSLTVPLSGDYDISLDATLGLQSAGLARILLSYVFGPVAASDFWALESGQGNNIQSCHRVYRHQHALKDYVIAERAKMTVAGVNGSLSKRTLSFVPVRVKAD